MILLPRQRLAVVAVAVTSQCLRKCLYRRWRRWRRWRVLVAVAAVVAVPFLFFLFRCRRMLR
jgi:hypothetical protein